MAFFKLMHDKGSRLMIEVIGNLIEWTFSIIIKKNLCSGRIQTEFVSSDVARGTELLFFIVCR